MTGTVTDVKAYQWYAGGHWRDVTRGRLFDDFEPDTGNLYARVADRGAEEARLAISAADEAFGAWAELPASSVVVPNSPELSDIDRAAVLHGAAVSLLPRLTTHPRLDAYAAPNGR